MPTAPETPREDLAQLLTRVLKANPAMTQTELAERIGVSVSAVNSWINRTRGGKRGPNKETLEKLAAATGEPKEAVFAAAARKTPGDLPPDREQRIIEYVRGLTEEQQEAAEIQLKALAEHNRSGA